VLVALGVEKSLLDYSLQRTQEGRHVGRDQSFEKPISRPARDKLDGSIIDGSITKKKTGSFNLRRSLATHRKVLGDQAVDEICAIS
jgi:hypothetical protein